MNTTTAQQATYRIEGEFLGFIALKYIQVKAGDRIIPIKLAKELRETIGQELKTGDRLAVFLEQKGSGNLSKLKLKSDRLEILARQGESLRSESRSALSSVSSISEPEKSDRGKILICRKSSCSRRGGKQLYRTLIETLKQLGLQERVSIELTDCQKQCKQAPSLILMPGHVKHAYVHPNNLASLLTAHYL
ncbi:(2Fe-2S) ferredoxin domain-containing protein [Pleurocapsales cyanobacterium LEGE 10410]|nr:(2Fe-2S) ferredoxin domain-containing protein [Pleurocapsales cyanobacterium LEGE 10410]